MNNGKKTFVLTGSTGNFGRFLASELLPHDDVQLVLLVRAKSMDEARARVEETVGERGDTVQIFRSDLTTGHLGLSESDYLDLASRATHILHSAASIRFTLPIEEARRNNVRTTESMLSFAKQCPRLIRFGFISSALIAGKRLGVIKEDEFEHKAGFKNTYEQSKYEAEALVRESAKELPVAIFRLPLVVTPESYHNSRGQISFLSFAVSFIRRGYLPFIPGTENSRIDVVEGTDAAGRIIELMLKRDLSHLTYQITNGAKALTIKTIHTMIEQKLGKTIPLEFCGDMGSFSRRLEKIPWYRPKLKMAYKRTASFLPEAAYSKIFDNSNTLSELEISHIGRDPVEVLHRIF